MRKLFLLAFALLLSPSLWATTYYVSSGTSVAGGSCASTGNDSNNGTSPATPWLTLAKPIAVGQSPGDSVLLQRDCMWREQLTAPSAGASNNPITWGAYGTGAKPQINAANLVTGTWTTNTASYGFTFDADTSTGLPGDFTSVTDSGGLLTQVTSPVNSGTKAYKLSPPTTANHYLDKTGLSYASSFYSAFYVNFGTGYNWGAFEMENVRVTGDYFYDVTGNFVNGFPAISWVHNKPGNATDFANFPLNFNTWYLVETTCTGIGTSSGVFTGYVNGQQVFQTTGLNWSAGYTINEERLGMIGRFATSSAGNVYFDNGWTHTSTTAGAPNTWKATLATQPKVVEFNGNHGLSHNTQGSLVNPGDWTWAGNTLYAYGTVAPSTTYASIEGSVRDFGVLNDTKDWVTYDNLDLRNANQFGIRVQNSNHVSLTNSLSTQNALGGTNVNDGGGQSSSFINWTGNEVSFNGGTGIDTNCGACGAITVANVSIANNSVHDNGWNPDNATGYIGTTGGIKVFGTQTTNVSILNNQIWNQQYTYLNPTIAGDVISGSGIWMDTIGTNAVAEYNQSYNNRGYGLVTEFTNVSPAPVMAYNVATGNYGGIGSNRNSQNLLIYNNSAYGNLFCGLCNEGVGGQTAQIGNQFKNNISSGNLYNLVAQLGGENAGGGSGNVYDHNNFGPAASNFVQWGAGVFKSTYSALDTAYGSSTNSIQGDPLFSNPPGNLSLQSGSPAIDSGLNLGASYQLGLDPRTSASAFGTVNQNSFGAGWDLGAFVALNSAPGGVSTVIRSGPTLPAIAPMNSIFIINDGSGAIYVCSANPCTTPLQWVSVATGQAANASAEVSPNQLGFGTVQNNTTSPSQPAAISNNGNVPITVQSMGFTGSKFSLVNPLACLGVLTAGGTCPFLLQYSPTGAGADTSTMTAVTTAPTDPNSPLTVNLTGSGTASATFLLSVANLGTGAGKIVGDGTTPINCVFAPPAAPSGTCAVSYVTGSVVNLTATSLSGGTFGGFSGGGCSTSPCAVTVTANTTVTGTFNPPIPTHVLSVSGTDQGIGSVASDVAGISCTSSAGVLSGSCSASYPDGTVVTLTETPSASCTGAACTFVGWTGVAGCTTASTCVVTVNSNLTVSVDFAQPAAGNPLTLVQSIGGGTQGGGSIAFVKNCQNSVSAPPNFTSITVNCAIAAGHSYIAFVRGAESNGLVISVSDSAGQSAVLTSSGQTTSANNYSNGMFFMANSAAVSSVTANFGGTTITGNAALIVMDFTGLAASSTQDGGVNSNDNSGAATTDASGALTTANANDVLIFCTSTSIGAGGFTVGSGYTLAANGTSNDRIACQYKIVASTQSGVSTSITTANALVYTTVFSAFKGAPGGGVVTGNWAQAQTAGDLLLCSGKWNDNTTTVTTLADTMGNTYTQCANSPKTVSGLSVALYHADNIAAAVAGANTTTLTLNASPTVAKLACVEYSGAPAVPLDACAGATGTGTAIISGNVTTSQASDLLVGTDAVAGSITAVAPGFIQRVANNIGDVEDKLAGAASTYAFAPTQSSASNWAAIVAAIKTSGTTTTVTVNLAGLGMGSGTVSGGGFNCNFAAGVTSGVCSVSVVPGSTLSIAAQPSGGSAFNTYSGGGCSTAPSCLTNAITSNTQISANFALSGLLNYYVNGSTGNDTHSGLCAVAGTPSGCTGPWATLSKANSSFSVGGGGTQINVANATYASPDFTRGGSSKTVRVIYQCTSGAASATAASGQCVINTGGAGINIETNNIDIVGFDIGNNINMGTGIDVITNAGSTGNSAHLIGNYIHDLASNVSPSAGDAGGPGCPESGAILFQGGEDDAQALRNYVTRYGSTSTRGVCNFAQGIYASGEINAQIIGNLVVQPVVGGIVLGASCGAVIANNVIINTIDAIIFGDHDNFRCPGGVPGHNTISNNYMGSFTNGFFGVSSGLDCSSSAPSLRAHNITDGGGTLSKPAVASCDTVTNAASTTQAGASFFVNYQLTTGGDFHLKSGSAGTGQGSSACTVGGINPCVPSTGFAGAAFPSPTDVGIY